MSWFPAGTTSPPSPAADAPRRPRRAAVAQRSCHRPTASRRRSDLRSRRAALMSPVDRIASAGWAEPGGLAASKQSGGGELGRSSRAGWRSRRGAAHVSGRSRRTGAVGERRSGAEAASSAGAAEPAGDRVAGRLMSPVDRVASARRVSVGAERRRRARQEQPSRLGGRVVGRLMSPADCVAPAAWAELGRRSRSGLAGHAQPVDQRRSPIINRVARRAPRRMPRRAACRR